MASVSLYEAKSRLSALVEQVEAGQEVIITKRGRPVAKIVRAAPATKKDRRAALARIRAFAKTSPIPKLSLKELKELIAEGRRY